MNLVSRKAKRETSALVSFDPLVANLLGLMRGQRRS